MSQTSRIVNTKKVSWPFMSVTSENYIYVANFWAFQFTKRIFGPGSAASSRARREEECFLLMLSIEAIIMSSPVSFKLLACYSDRLHRNNKRIIIKIGKSSSGMRRNHDADSSIDFASARVKKVKRTEKRRESLYTWSYLSNRIHLRKFEMPEGLPKSKSIKRFEKMPPFLAKLN